MTNNPPIDWSTEPAGPRMDEAVAKISNGTSGMSYSIDGDWAMRAAKRMNVIDREILSQPGDTIALRACRAILKHERK